MPVTGFHRFRGVIVSAGLAAAALVVPLSSQAPLLVVGTPPEMGSGSRRVFLTDVDGDSRADLVALLLDNTIAVRFGDGAGRFREMVTTRLAFEPGAVVLGDVSADGDTDVVVAWRDATSEYVSTLPGAGGRFAAQDQPAIRLGPALQYYKPFVRLLDLNRNGVADIVAGSERGPGFQIVLGTGQGRFGSAITVPYDPPGAEYYSPGFADVDGDGAIDVVLAATMAGSSAPRLVVTRGDGRGGFAGRIESPLAVAADPRVAAIGDLNADAAPDLVLTRPEARTIDVLLNDGRGRFVPAPWSPLRARLPAAAVAITDATGDARPDLVALTVNSVDPAGASEVAVFVGHERGFSLAVGSPFPVAPSAFSLALGDINGDGKVDVATSSRTTERLTVLLAR
jgi:hypothetical protein